MIVNTKIESYMKITKQGVDFFYFALLISINEIGAITNSVPNKKSKEKTLNRAGQTQISTKIQSRIWCTGGVNVIHIQFGD